MFNLFHSKTIQALSAWIGVATGAFTLLSRFTPEWFGTLSWPQAILLGIGFALAAGLILSITLVVGAYGFRLFRPLPHLSREAQSEVGGAAIVAAPAYDDTAVRAEIQTLREEFAEHKEHIAKAVSDIDRARLEGQNELGRKIEDLTREFQKLQDIDRNHRDRAREAFHAIGARERVAALEATIRRDAADLHERLEAGEAYDAAMWQQWENVHGHWEKALDEWLGTGTWYALAVKERTLTVDDAKYGAAWSVADSQFPDAEAVRRFKKFWIIQQQWEGVVPDVKTGMDQVAFLGMTEKEARRGTPAG